METVNVTIEVKQVGRFPGRTAYEATVSEGPEWMRHQTETASTRSASYERFADRLVMLYGHRATLAFERTDIG